MPELKYKRVLLKLSGEALAGRNKNGIDSRILDDICAQIKNITSLGLQVAIVIGGGNIWRGRNDQKMDRTTADYMGMLATIINGLALQDALEKNDIEAELQTSIAIEKIAQTFTKKRAVECLNKGKVVIFAGGTSNPYFTTDTAAALRAAEIEADVILLAKTIDGVYSSDPKIDASAIKYDEITYIDVLNKDLKVMDSTATSLCRDNNIPLIVFGMDHPDNITKIIKGEKIGTIVKGE